MSALRQAREHRSAPTTDKRGLACGAFPCSDSSLGFEYQRPGNPNPIFAVILGRAAGAVTDFALATRRAGSGLAHNEYLPVIAIVKPRFCLPLRMPPQEFRHG